MLEFCQPENQACLSSSCLKHPITLLSIKSHPNSSLLLPHLSRWVLPTSGFSTEDLIHSPAPTSGEFPDFSSET